MVRDNYIGSTTVSKPSGSWLQTHFESFVRPVLGDMTPSLQTKQRSLFFTPQDMAMIKNMWRSIKYGSVTTGRPVLLAGRDVWVFEVLARRENFPTTFRPDISRHTVNYVKEDYRDHLLFDTGFMGSIPKGLKIEHFLLASWAEEARKNRHITGESRQVFPRMSGARSLALKIERTPKYWHAGYARDAHGEAAGRWFYTPIGEVTIHQELANTNEFYRAAFLTLEIYKDSSPKFVEKLVTPRRYSMFDEW